MDRETSLTIHIILNNEEILNKIILRRDAMSKRQEREDSLMNSSVEGGLTSSVMEKAEISVVGYQRCLEVFQPPCKRAADSAD
jgi:hypothetical protein